MYLLIGLGYNFNYSIKSHNILSNYHMGKNRRTADRKTDHLRIVLDEKVNSSLSNGFEKYRFIHQALPEIDFTQIETKSNFLKKTLDYPILISSMTGGTPETAKINHCLAKVAQKYGIAMGVGSQRIGIEDSTRMYSFNVRKLAPDILLFANLGAVQLNYSHSTEQCQKAVDEIEANALFLHLNPLQEALQPEGNTNFSGLLKKIELVCKTLSIPVFIKEVGWGISEKTASLLVSAGIAGIDVAGAGGTSWSEVEKYRIKDPVYFHVASAFHDWGIPTADSIIQVKKAAPTLSVIASGGITNGIEIAKSIALGSSMAGLAARFIRAASISFDETENILKELILQLKICMFAIGAKNIHDLKNIRIIRE